MKVLVDTSVWSLALRRRTQLESPVVTAFQELINDGRVELLGVVRQELLSGLRQTEQFKRLRQYLRAFADVSLCWEDYETAAEYFNICRNRGIQGSQADFLIAATAARRNWLVFTTDQDFRHYAQHLPLQLYAHEK